MITVYSHILVGFFLSCMKICLHEYAKGALFPGALRLADAAKELQSSGEPRSGGKAFTRRFCEWRKETVMEQYITKVAGGRKC